jgi:putative two-component system response regulator
MSALPAANDRSVDDSAALLQLVAALRPENPQLESDLQALLARLAETRAMESSEVVGAAVEPLLARLPPSPTLADCLLLLSLHCLQSSSSWALPLADAAADIAGALPDASRQFKALNLGGLLYSAAFDLDSAFQRFARALSLARQRGDSYGEAKALVNVGVTHARAAHADAAVGAYQAALRLDLRVAKTAYTNLTYIYLLLRDYESARKSAEDGLALIDPNAPNSTEDSFPLMLRANYIHALASGGHADLAQGQIPQLKASARTPLTSPDLCVILLAEGITNIASGAVVIGTSQLGQGLDLARRSAPADLSERLDAGVRGYELAGQPDLALACLQEMLDLRRRRAFDLLRTPAPALRLEAAANEEAIRLEHDIVERLERLLSAAQGAKDKAGHSLVSSLRIAALAHAFAVHECWTPEDADALFLSARLCDVGMIAVPPSLLCKSGPLTEGERKVVAEHTSCGGDLLVQARLKALQPCALVARFHHERWDGGGPWRLSGDGIPLPARVVALCDVFDALTHDRPWRKARSVPAAIRAIERSSGAHFDPRLAPRFCTFVRDLFWSQDDFDAYLLEQAQDATTARRQ